ncbi:DNA polymerase [Luteolibacter soli]|uniref:DNA polymerase n=1 Tax=Luteolibacter soli TaxID=3135280 RepID=A0ABU9B2Q2_9BACT
MEFAFHASPGERPVPICLVANTLPSGRIVRLGGEALASCGEVPFDVGLATLVVAFNAEDALGCFRALGWQVPVNLIDLYTEFRNFTNGLPMRIGRDLCGALLTMGVPFANVVGDPDVDHLLVRGGPYSYEEQSALLKNCEARVEGIGRLWSILKPRLDSRALLRGDYMKAVADMEWQGIPVDGQTVNALQNRWHEFQSQVLHSIDPFERIWCGGRFDQLAFVRYTRNHGIDWPRLEGGFLDLSNDTFSEMATLFPRAINGIYRAKQVLDQINGCELVIGRDGRNRVPLSPFWTTSGRNQPSTRRFAFDLSSWMRRFIQPQPGMALAYIDWCHQEIGVAAGLSGDKGLQDACMSSDPYIAFARMAGAAPVNATKLSHPQIREIFKVALLGVGYSMSPAGLARRLGISEGEASYLLSMHGRCYPDFWKWSDGACDYGQLARSLYTRFGWSLRVTPDTKFTTLRNFPCQANAAEMMRLAAIYGVEEGLSICAPVHDAFLIEAPVDHIDHHTALFRSCMDRASGDVLGGFVIRTEVQIYRFPHRFGHRNANPIWDLAMKVLG